MNKDIVSHKVAITLKEKGYNIDCDNKCLYCNSYQDGWCTNFGKEVNAEDSCEHYQCDIVEYTCKNCGRKYQYSDSDAICRDKFCCKACEYGC